MQPSGVGSPDVQHTLHGNFEGLPGRTVEEWLRKIRPRRAAELTKHTKSCEPVREGRTVLRQILEIDETVEAELATPMSEDNAVLGNPHEADP